MRVIRHAIDIVAHQSVQLPAGGELLSAAVSRTAPDDLIDVWSIDYEAGDPRTVDVFIVGTGHPISTDAQDAVAWGRFIGTVVTPIGLVWHIWQGKIS